MTLQPCETSCSVTCPTNRLTYWQSHCASTAPSRALIPGLPGLTAAVDREVAAATDGLLSLNLADVAAAGWKKYDALRQAARRTRDAPTTQEVVALATHNIQSSHHPTVELFIDGKSIATIEIELQIAFTMAGMLAVVRQARLTAIRSGTCTVTGSLAIQQTVITKRQRRFDLPGAVRLRHGVPLLEPAASTVPVARPLSGIPNRPTSPGPGTPIRRDGMSSVGGTGHGGLSASRPRAAQ